MCETYEFYNDLERNAIMIDLALSGWKIESIEYDTDFSSGVIYAKF